MKSFLFENIKRAREVLREYKKIYYDVIDECAALNAEFQVLIAFYDPKTDNILNFTCWRKDNLLEFQLCKHRKLIAHISLEPKENRNGQLVIKQFAASEDMTAYYPCVHFLIRYTKGLAKGLGYRSIIGPVNNRFQEEFRKRDCKIKPVENDNVFVKIEFSLIARFIGRRHFLSIRSGMKKFHKKLGLE
jgi:hypothetical protein